MKHVLMLRTLDIAALHIVKNLSRFKFHFHLQYKGNDSLVAFLSSPIPSNTSLHRDTTVKGRSFSISC